MIRPSLGHFFAILLAVGATTTQGRFPCRVNGTTTRSRKGPFKALAAKPFYLKPDRGGTAMFCSSVTPRILILVAAFLTVLMASPALSATPFVHETVDAPGLGEWPSSPLIRSNSRVNADEVDDSGAWVTTNA